MTDVLARAWQAVATFLAQLWTFLQTSSQRLGPLEWGGVAAALLIFLLLFALLRRRNRDPQQNRPEVLISLGAISASEGFDADSGVLLPKRFLLKMTVSNLNTYPVQALELALKTPEMEVPVTAELATLIPPESSVVVKETLPELVGDEGKLNLYLYAANSSKKTYRLQTAFALEPWNARYKISPLGQSIAPTRQLASTGVNRVQERAWREQEERERSQRQQLAFPEDRRGERTQEGREWRREYSRNQAQQEDKQRGGQPSGPRVYNAPETTERTTERGEQLGFPDEF